MRPIDADELLKKKREMELCFAVTVWDIEDAPTIDPESLRPTGEWIFKHNPITDPKGYFIRIVCSECNLHTGQKSNYCPNCGAKMKEAT